MKVIRTFNRHGQLYREGESVPDGALPGPAIPLLINEGWIEPESAEVVPAEAKHEEPVQPKKAAKRRKK